LFDRKLFSLDWAMFDDDFLLGGVVKPVKLYLISAGDEKKVFILNFNHKKSLKKFVLEETLINLILLRLMFPESFFNWIFSPSITHSSHEN
jgi:hypothetical protein